MEANKTMEKTNKLKNTRVYLAGNIEYTNDAINWREYVKKDLNKIGVKILSPIDQIFVNQPKEDDISKQRLLELRKNEDYDTVAKYMKRVCKIDLRSIDCADFVIINLEISKPTFGSIHELIVSIDQKKPIFLVLEKKLCPLWILGIISHRSIYNTINEALKAIHDIDEGIVEMDEDKWRILVEELR